MSLIGNFLKHADRDSDDTTIMCFHLSIIMILNSIIFLLEYGERFYSELMKDFFEIMTETLIDTKSMVCRESPEKYFQDNIDCFKVRINPFISKHTPSPSS